MKTKPRIEIDLAQVEAHAARGLTQEQIADALGIGQATLYQKKSVNREISEAIKRGKAKGIGNVANVIYENATKRRESTAAIFF